MRNIEKDLDYLKRGTNLEVGRLFNGDRLFQNTNERLGSILPNFDFNNKNVLSVMASADQVFSAYYLGAKNVDTFDKNWLTYYMFYLKKWYLIHYKSFNFISDKYMLLECCMEYDKDNEEEIQIHSFWKRFLQSTDSDGLDILFMKKFEFEWNVPYEHDFKKLELLIKNKRANFMQFNIIDKIQSKNKYDIIILSNIMEFIENSSWHIFEEEYIICDNLRNSLTDNGIVICSILNDPNSNKRCEREAFKPYFDYKLSNLYGYNPISCTEEPMYYTYKKKKI